MDSVLIFLAFLGLCPAVGLALYAFRWLGLRRGWLYQGGVGANRPMPWPAPPPESPLVVRNRETMAESERIIRSAYQRTREPTRPAPPLTTRTEATP